MDMRNVRVLYPGSDETAIDEIREKVHKTIKYALGTRK